MSDSNAMHDAMEKHVWDTGHPCSPEEAFALGWRAALEARTGEAVAQPTKAMLEAAEHYQRHEYVYDEFRPHKLYEGIYHAMLAAAPIPPTGDAAGKDSVDAARYRFLRNPDPQPCRELDVCDDEFRVYDGADLDSRIDAAIASLTKTAE